MSTNNKVTTKAEVQNKAFNCTINRANSLAMDNLIAIDYSIISKTSIENLHKTSLTCSKFNTFPEIGSKWE